MLYVEEDEKMRKEEVPHYPTGSTERKRMSGHSAKGKRAQLCGDESDMLPAPWVDHCAHACFSKALGAIRAPNPTMVEIVEYAGPPCPCSLRHMPYAIWHMAHSTEHTGTIFRYIQ